MARLTHLRMEGHMENFRVPLRGSQGIINGRFSAVRNATLQHGNIFEKTQWYGESLASSSVNGQDRVT